jgi:AcrR family transcriptional regulator
MARPRSDIRTRVLHAARDRFLHDGVDGASLRRIATDAGTSIGMVYYYFPTKDDLFLGVVEEVYQVVLADLLDALESGRTVEERLRGLYRRIGAVTNEEQLVIRLVLREALVSSSRLDQIIERFQRGHLPAMMKLLVDGLGDGTFDSTIHPLLILLSVMALGGPAQLIHRRLADRSPFPGSPAGDALSEQMLGILFNGVGGLRGLAKPKNSRSS